MTGVQTCALPISTKAVLPDGIKDISELSDDDIKIFISKFDNMVLSMLQLR